MGTETLWCISILLFYKMKILFSRVCVVIKAKIEYETITVSINGRIMDECFLQFYHIYVLINIIVFSAKGIMPKKNKKHFNITRINSNLVIFRKLKRNIFTQYRDDQFIYIIHTHFGSGRCRQPRVRGCPFCKLAFWVYTGSYNSCRPFRRPVHHHAVLYTLDYTRTLVFLYVPRTFFLPRTSLPRNSLSNQNDL